jgi:NitT/TauT family transport system permease protein
MGNASVLVILFKLRLPHALPHVFVGLKIAAGASVVGALVGETFAGSSAVGAGGLGYSSIYALSQLDTPYLFALIFSSSLLGLLFFFAVSILERLMVGKWHESILGDRIE